MTCERRSAYAVRRPRRAVRIDRLRQVAVHAGRQAALAVALHGVRGHRDDARVAAGPMPRARGSRASPRSPPISGICTSISTTSKDDRRERRERFEAVVGDVHRVAAPGQQADRDALVDDVVFGQQDRARARPAPSSGVAWPIDRDAAGRLRSQHCVQMASKRSACLIGLVR